MKATVIVSTYNRPNHLKYSILGFSRQTCKDFEVVIADDGSKPETTELIKELQEKMPFSISHVWQEDKGFRKSKILNEAIRAAQADYLIFTDGDCIPKDDFVQVHLDNASEKHYAGGGYVRLDEKYTEALTEEMVLAGEFEKELKRPEHWKPLKKKARLHKFYILFPFIKKRRPKFLGLNFAVHKKNAYQVNGMDENYEGWGQEDSDFRERLKVSGLKPKSLWIDALNFHQYHYEHPTKKIQPNKDYSRRKGLTYWCEKGLDSKKMSPS